MTTAQLLRQKYPSMSDGDLTKLVEIEDKLASSSAALSTLVEPKLCIVTDPSCTACE